MKTQSLAGAVLAFTLACPMTGHAAETVRSADISTRNLTESDFPRWQELAPDVYAYEGIHMPGNRHSINTVSLIVVTTEGVVVVDGQGDVSQTKLMVDNIRKLTPQPIRYVVIASDHGDHVGGNSAFKAEFPDVEFIASPVSKKALADKDHPSIQSVPDKREIRLGKTNIHILNLGRAHTGGDLVVYLPETKVLFLSEIYLREVFPAMRSAYPSEWLETIRKAKGMDVSWYVPGHGFVDDQATMRRDLEESRAAIAHVIDEAKRLRGAGHTCESPANCPAAQKVDWGAYKDWALRSSQAPVAIARVYQELDGRLAK